jgi:hypothetical protein
MAYQETELSVCDIYDPDEFVLSDSPILKPLIPRLQHSPSPPPDLPESEFQINYQENPISDYRSYPNGYFVDLVDQIRTYGQQVRAKGDYPSQGDAANVADDGMDLISNIEHDKTFTDFMCPEVYGNQSQGEPSNVRRLAADHPLPFVQGNVLTLFTVQNMLT